MKWVVIGGSRDPELHSSVSSIRTGICGLVQSWDEPGVSQHQVLYGYKLPDPKGLLPGQRRGKRNRECCHLYSVPEEMQHKARRSVQILSVEAFQFAILPWQIFKVVGGNVAKRYRKQDLKYRCGIGGTFGKSASKVLVRCHLKESAQADAGRLRQR